jgi:hypothetical protein
MYKQIKMLAVLLLFLVAVIPTSIFAVEQGNYNNVDVVRIDVDDKEFKVTDANGLAGTVGPVYAGERISIEVFWEADGGNWSEFDAKITVELDDEEDETEDFRVSPNWADDAKFVFNLPNDMDVGNYVLHVELEDENGHKNLYSEIVIEVANENHFVDIYDVNFRNGLEVNAGDTFFTSIGVKNLGFEDQEDVAVSITIPELGLFQRSSKFDLFSEDYVKNDNSADEDDEWKLYKDLFVTIPSNTASGVYDVVVKVNYDDGDKSEEEVYSLVVRQGATQADDVISIDKDSQDFAQGSGAIYRVLFPAGSDYNVEVTGVDSFGSVIVTEVENGAQIFVTAREDAASGSYPVTVKVMSGTSVVKVFDATANVTKLAEGSVTDIKEGLQIGFAILLVILIILGIILAAKKIGKSDDYEESLMDEGETYY